MQTVLVTGANGFVGSYLVPLLLQKSYKVVATGKGECRLPYQHENLEYQSLDFTDAETVDNVFETFQPQIVVHAGALSKPDECELQREAAFRTNVTGTKNLIIAAAHYNSFFLFLSTDFIFSGEQGMYAEEDTAAPVNYYGETKLLAEKVVQEYTGPWSIVRTVLVYGKPICGRGNLLTSVAENLKSGKPLKIFNDQVRTPTYVEDLAKGIVSIIEKEKRGIFHLSGSDVMTPYDMAIAVAKYLHLNESLITPVEEAEFDEPARRPPKTGFNLNKAKKELGYAPISFTEGLQKTFAD